MLNQFDLFSIRRLINQVHSRRSFFSSVYTGLAGIGLTNLLLNDLSAESDKNVLKNSNGWKPGANETHFPAKAKRVLQIFCPGAASHMDLWEHKPGLEKYHGKPLPGEENLVSFQGKNGNLMKSPWAFKPAGQSGKMFSTLLPHMSQHCDEIAFVHSMTTKTNTHGPGCVFMNTGHDTEGYPSAGAWLGYALGSENENLPAYIAIPDIRGEPPNGKANWSNGFLPAQHQAIVMNAQSPIRNLKVPKGISQKKEQATREFLKYLDQRHAEQRPGNSDLQARIEAYELAARMQLSAPEVSNLASEPKSIHEQYGTSDPNKLKAAYAAIVCSRDDFWNGVCAI